MKWEFRGRKLAPLHIITRRLIAWPILILGRVIYTFATFIGWGFEHAADAWNDLD